MESIRVKAAKAFSKGQFEKNCLMLAEKIEIVPLTNVNETDVNIVGKKFEINRVNYEYRKKGHLLILCSRLAKVFIRIYILGFFEMLKVLFDKTIRFYILWVF